MWEILYYVPLQARQSSQNGPAAGHGVTGMIFPGVDEMLSRILGGSGPSDTIIRDISSNQAFMQIVADEAVANPGISLQKYLNYRRYIRVYYRDAVALHLDRKPHRVVLDIGTGVGYFPFICSHLGNSAWAIDVDDYPVYNKTIAALRINRQVHRIVAFQSLPSLPTRFDLVTAFATCFNNHKMPNLWGEKEWEFFLRDIANNQLNPAGKIFLRINKEDDGGFARAEIPQMMRSLGASISSTDVRFDDVSRLLT